jgi:hypothetical protein
MRRSGGPRSGFNEYRHARTHAHSHIQAIQHHIKRNGTLARTQKHEDTHEHTYTNTRTHTPGVPGDDTVCFPHTLFTPHLSHPSCPRPRIHAHAYAHARNRQHAERTRRWRLARTHGRTDEEETRNAGGALRPPILPRMPKHNALHACLGKVCCAGARREQEAGACELAHLYLDTGPVRLGLCAARVHPSIILHADIFL